MGTSTVPKALTISMVETIEVTIEAKSIAVLWAIEETTLNAITEVVDSTIEATEVVDPHTTNASQMCMIGKWSIPFWWMLQ